MGIESKYIWMEGELVEYEKATVPFLSSALHYGLGVFEGIRCYNTEKGAAVFRLKEHMDRLINSANAFDRQPLAPGEVRHGHGHDEFAGAPMGDPGSGPQPFTGGFSGPANGGAPGNGGATGGGDGSAGPDGSQPH